MTALEILLRRTEQDVAAWGRRSHRTLLAVALSSILFAASCSRPIRISPHALDKLGRNGERFVLVFGSLSTPKGKLDHPAIRFSHPDQSGNPDALLWAATITTGERFYAALHAPPGAEYLDGFYVEVSSESVGFDRIIYSRLRKGDEPVAIYVGEIAVTPALDRSEQGQKVTVEATNDFQVAQRELRRLYPRFTGAVISRVPAHPSRSAAERVNP